jgi:cupin fold WbuC family metalloprotein
LKIYDKKGALLAIVVRGNEIKEGRNFLTDDSEEVQIAAFNFKNKTIIEKHIHLNQKREVYTTSETLIILDGSMEVKIFDNSEEFIESVTLGQGDSISLLRGGHGIEIETSCKFIETKQGPYTEDLDKKRF